MTPEQLLEIAPVKSVERVLHDLVFHARHEPSWLSRQPRRRVYRLHSLLLEQLEANKKAQKAAVKRR